MIKAWAFYRRSIERQEVSIEDQRRACHQFAKEQGWQIVREFIPEKGYCSGLTIDTDPQFIEMMRLAETMKGTIQKLIVYDVSRFGRLEPDEKIYWEQHLKKRCGMLVVYVKDIFKNDGSLEDFLHRGLKHSAAHEFSIKLSELVLRGCLTHARMGRSSGGAPPYGYNRLLLDKHGKPVKVLHSGERKMDNLQHIIWVPGSKEQVRTVIWIFKSFSRGIGYRKLACSLNRRKIFSAAGTTWSRTTVSYILKNIAYTGVRMYNVRNWNRAGRRGIKPKSEWIRRDNAHKALISKELFKKVQTRWRKGTNTGPWRAYLFTGLMHCKHCGYLYHGLTQNQHGKKVIYYLCDGYVTKGPTVCASFFIPAPYLEGFAIAEIQNTVSSPSRLKSIESGLKRMLDSFNKSGKKENLQKGLEKNLEKTERQIHNIVEVIKQRGSYPTLLAELDRLETDRKRLIGVLEESKAKKPIRFDYKALSDEVNHLGDFSRIMANGPFEEKQSLMKTFIHRIEMAPEIRKASIYFYKVPGLQNKVGFDLYRKSLKSFCYVKSLKIPSQIPTAGMSQTFGIHGNL